MVLRSINWPQASQTTDSDDEVQVETLTLITGFFRSFVEEGNLIVIFMVYKIKAS